MKKGTKIGIGVGALVGVIALVTIAASSREGGVMVRTEGVTRRDLVATVNASGWIRPNRRVEVQADIMGRIIELNVEEGDVVKTGQVLLRIDPTQFVAALKRAEAMVSEARAREAQTKANLVQSQRAHERLTQLAASDANLVSRQQIEEAETQVSVQTELATAATYGVQQARSALEEAEDRLSKTVIRAPMNGVVTRLNVEIGSTAIVGTTNNPGSILLTVADVSTMEAVVRVDETYVPNLSIGDSASITIDALPRQQFTGRVSEIGYSAVRSPLQQVTVSSAQGQAIDYEVVIRLENPPESLRSDLSVSADIVTAKRPGALSIPIIALTMRERTDTAAIEHEDPAAEAAATAAVAGAARGNDEEGVFVVREGKAVFVPVTVGIAGQEYFEVLSGVTEADTVVAGPYEVIRTLQNGAVVRLIPGGQSSRSNSGAQAAARGS